MISRTLLLLLPFVTSQIIDISICTDNSCTKNCVSWRTNSGDCSVCASSVGRCSLSNPSSRTTLNSITLYSDDKCNILIQGTSNTPINSDNICHPFQFGGSYRAQNISLLIGISVGIVIIVIITTAVCIYKRPRCNRNQAPQSSPNNNAIILNNNDTKVPDYFNNSEFGTQIVQQPALYSYNYQQPAPQFYVANTQPYAVPQSYIQNNYGNQNYYPQYPVPPQPSAPPYYEQQPKVV